MTTATPAKESLEKCHCMLLQNYRILKLFFIILASIMILGEIYYFSAVKPTYTSHTMRDISSEDFPEILLCPLPSVDKEALASKGYGGSFEYSQGINWDDALNASVVEHIGWAGNNSEDVGKVAVSVSKLKSSEDCPYAYFYDESLNPTKIEWNLTKVLYPNHICCKVVPPEFSKFNPISVMDFSSRSGYENISYKLFMADGLGLTASYFDLHKDIMVGDEIVSSTTGFFEYTVQINEEEKLENDPAYPCINYEVGGEYAKCRETEMVRKNSKYVNCTPPWMTDNEDLWCKGRFRLAHHVPVLKYIGFLSEIRMSTLKSGKCLIPCKIKRYEVKRIGFGNEKWKGMTVYFDKTVKSAESTFTMDGWTLISKIGGYIGVNKNFLWLIIFSISSIGVLISKFKARRF